MYKTLAEINPAYNFSPTPSPTPVTNVELTQLSDGITDIYNKISNAVTQKTSDITAKIDKTGDTVAKATDTANKALDMVNGFMTFAKPVAIAAGALLTTLVITDIYLNFREIRKGA